MLEILLTTKKLLLFLYFIHFLLFLEYIEYTLEIKNKLLFCLEWLLFLLWRTFCFFNFDVYFITLFSNWQIDTSATKKKKIHAIYLHKIFAEKKNLNTNFSLKMKIFFGWNLKKLIFRPCFHYLSNFIF